ncbi:hypothetical protein [Pseudomonas aeruginosa]|uniref:hypothetical protein n=1 Tax=Pseudomonas aeruginosa TaxID=287 RepID=UPI001FF7380F|nr:hypothetical protein [Pseudomonas aeruginosa]MCK1838891.1 hypothetical protein [Pseudomonas aeruginosa]
MDFHEDFILNYLAHRIGVRVLLSERRAVQGRKRLCLGLAVIVGGLMLFAPFVAFIA